MRKIFLWLIIALSISGVGLAEETIKDGVKKEYYPNDVLKSEMTYKDGKPNGIYKVYREDGALLGDSIYENGVACSGKEYLASGQVKREFVCEGCNPKNADLKEYYENGQEFENVKIRNEIITELRSYYPEGKLRAEIILTDKNDKDAVEIEERDGASGRVTGLRYEKQIFYDEQGNILKNGILKGYSRNGKLRSENQIKNGKVDGASRYYYMNGKINTEVIFKNGKEVRRKEYDEKGKLKKAR